MKGNEFLKKYGAAAPDISKMSQQELVDLAIQIEEGESGMSFEESAKYWTDHGNQDRANLFIAMVDRWWELEEENHPMARIRNINPAYGDPVEFADTTKMAMSIESCGYELSADGLKEGRDYEVIGGCSVVF